MDRSRVFSSWLSIRPVAVLLTVGMVSVGVSGCGSSSNSSTPVVKKQAGLFNKDISLKITNRNLDSSITVYWCGHFDNPCNGTSIYHICTLRTGTTCTWISPGSPSGRILLPNGKYLTYGARNPTAGRPELALFHPREIVPLVEGEIQIRYREGYKIGLSREADGRDKNMTLEVFSP